jgi:hypothetical protein
MSEPAKFPVRRLRDAGATNAEIEELNRAFVRSDEVYQAEFAKSFLGKSKVEVIVWLEDARRDLLVSEDATNDVDIHESDEPQEKRFRREPEPTASITNGNEDDESAT